MIKLDLYRLLPEQHAISYPEPDVDCRYTPYHIFVLETRLYPFIYNLLSYEVKYKNLYIYPKSVYNKNTYRMDVYLRIVKLDNLSEEEVKLSREEKEKVENKLYQITSKDINYVLIDVNELYKSLKHKQYPFPWFQSILGYAWSPERNNERNTHGEQEEGNDNDYQAFSNSDGIYLQMNPNSEYKKEYHHICEQIEKRIDEFYKKGTIVLPDENLEFIQKWNLVSIAPNLYQANWRDYRFAKNPVDFLLNKVQEDPCIYLTIPDNLVARHFIMTGLQGIPSKIEGSQLKIEVDNLKEAQEVASLVDQQIAFTKGEVFVLVASRLSEVYLFTEYANKYKLGESVTYFVDEYPYIFSCLLQHKPDRLGERMRNYVTNRLVQVSKVSKFKNMSPHEIIEQEYKVE